ncbi:conserved hypothetical protein [Xanthomonas citri pv. citri str. 306]|uniref:Uncharacterized protein n=1 Tax=Xanthomonas axonopodis pv. citri (strain 306) TaxID=190486 RepID=A0AAI7ZCC6_XANAC|nr:conserved hypothetical protein [Xanthomonas citri pv. citri str. 306]
MTLDVYTSFRIDRVAARLACVGRSSRIAACCCLHLASIGRCTASAAPASGRRRGNGASQATTRARLYVGRPAQPLVALGSVAEGRLDLATGRPRTGHAGVRARVVRASGLADLAWPTRQVLAPTVPIEAPDQPIAGMGSRRLRCRRVSHDGPHVAFGDRWDRQRSAGPADRQFGLGRRAPGAGGQHDDQHEPRPDQAHDGLRSRPERGASPGGLAGRRITFVRGSAPDLTATLRLLAEADGCP